MADVEASKQHEDTVELPMPKYLADFLEELSKAKFKTSAMKPK